MLGTNKLLQISNRLAEITTNTDKPFGGISIIGVGDFY